MATASRSRHIPGLQTTGSSHKTPSHPRSVKHMYNWSYYSDHVMHVFGKTVFMFIVTAITYLPNFNIFHWFQFDNSPYLTTYIYLSIGSTLTTFIGCILTYQTGLVGCKVMFNKMVTNVIHLPMRYVPFKFLYFNHKAFSISWFFSDKKLFFNLQRHYEFDW